MKLTIGKLAKQANVTIETIRYYQRIGLLHEPLKPLNGYRQYPEQAIARIRFIKRAQQSGFTLKEISELLSLETEHCQDVQKLAEQKKLQIERQINDLVALNQALDNLLAGCRQGRTNTHCSLIDALSLPRD